MWGYPGGGMMGGGGFFGMLLMLLFGLLVLAILWLAVYWLVRLSSTQNVGAGPAVTAKPSDQAITILRERYARGEIDKAEYEQRLRDLSG